MYSSSHSLMRGQMVAIIMNSIRLKKPQLFSTKAASRESGDSKFDSLASFGSR